MKPRLVAVREPRRPEGVVIVLHGGASRQGQMMVSPTQLSVLRMIPVARRIARSGRGRLAVYRLLNSYRGWDTSHTPVDDAAWAVQQVAQRHGGEVPVCLVGHSLGGRAAVLSAGLPSVRGVAVLAAFVYPSDADRLGLSGRQVLFVHGLLDRIAPAERARQLAVRLARRNTVGFILLRSGKHAMLRGRRTFEGAAADFAVVTLLGRAPSRLVGDALTGGSVVEVA